MYSNHQTLRYINPQKRAGHRHIKWFEFIQEYTFVLKHHVGVDDKVVDASSRRLCTLQALSEEVIDFECLIKDYPTCRNFGEIYASLIQDPPILVKPFTLLMGLYLETPDYAFPTLLYGII